MTNQELAAKLRCMSTVHTGDPGCEDFSFWHVEPLPADMAGEFPEDFLSQCDCDRVGLTAADALENSDSHIAALQKEIETLRGQNKKLQAIATELQSKSQWVSVTERMPEKWHESDGVTLVNYMVYSPDFGVDIGNFYANAQRWLCMGLPGVVTHWMPLPEPPEEVTA